MSTRIGIPTWRCPCDYRQDFDPNDENRMAELFPGKKLGTCPSCGSEAISEVTDEAAKTAVIILDHNEVAKLKVTELHPTDNVLITRALTKTEQDRIHDEIDEAHRRFGPKT